MKQDTPGMLSLRHVRSVQRRSRGFMRQRGLVLPIALLFLLVMTLIAVTAMNTSTLQERMASNYRDRGLALESAESMMRVAESWLSNHDEPPDTGLPSKVGHSDPMFGGARSGGLPDVDAEPTVTITQLSEISDDRSVTMGQRKETGGRQYYRIEVTATGGTQDSQVVLETTYAMR